MKNFFRLHLNYQTRVYGLDLFRAAAIIPVVITHGTALLRGTRFENFPWVKMVDGVDLFFVLSGFLIGSILLKTMNDSKKFSLTDILSFWKRRWFRTLPLFYLFLLINWLFVNYSIIDGDIKQFNIKFFFFLHNFSSPFVDFFWESWSLSVEEWFYVFLPVLLFLFSFLLTTKRTFLIACIILIITPLIYRIYLSPLQVDDFWLSVTFKKTVLTRLDAIGYGILAAWVKFYYKEWWSKNKNVCFIAGILILLVALNVHAEANSFYSKTVSLILIPIGAMLLLPISDSIKNFKSGFGKVVTHISVISYAMYLINLSAISMVISKQFPPANTVDAVFKYLIYWFLVIVLSTVLYKYYEKPITDLRDKKKISTSK